MNITLQSVGERNNNRDYPGTNDVIDAALATNGVTVNGQTPWRKGEYFWALVKTNNSAAPIYEPVTIASGGTNVTGNLLLPKTPQTFVYDADGNLVSDGLWTNTWDAENRLVATESSAGVPPAARMKEEWSYLPDGRWNQRIVSAWNGSSYVPQYTNRFVWDGQVLLTILDQTNGLVMSFMWGLDLSGSMQGAGGVGGLLAVSFKTNGTHFVAFDGNGNVAALVNAADGTISANYEYGTFGEPIRITGSVGKLNPIRFSTQFSDDVTGDLKYLYRIYGPSTGGWKSRDPAEERGGYNLYGSFGNDAVNNADIFGLDIVVKCPEAYFRENDITPEMYDNLGGDRYHAKEEIQGPGGGGGEILWKMLQDSRTFTALAHSVEQLKLHVTSRRNVVREAFHVYWTMPAGNGQESFNSDYWNAPMLLNQTANPAKALEDPFLCPQCYRTGCKNASMLVLLKGILDTIGSGQFNGSIQGQPTRWIDSAALRSRLVRYESIAAGGAHPGLGNWVPGDRGYIRGSAGNGLDAGEWIIHLGYGDNFWGFYRDRSERVRTLQQWVDADFMNGAGSETGQRFWPGVGLE